MVQKLFTVFLICCVFFFSCETMPKGQVEQPKVEEPKVEEKISEVVVQEEPLPPPVEEKEPEKPNVEKEKDNEVIAEFGDVKITKKDYHDTMDEIKKIVDGLNKTTATSDYNTWLTYLSESYKAEYSKKSTLKSTVDNLKKKKVVGLKLETLNDYFKYVFVAARQNIRVDDIEFLSPVRVNVLMITKGKKLLVYDLEKINNRWLLVPRT